jgi:hypothetical protein
MLKYPAIAVGALASMQLLLWLAIGIWTLPRKIPGIIRQDVSLEIQRVNEGRLPLPHHSTPEAFVLCDKLARVTQASDLDKINEFTTPYNLFYLTPEQAKQPPASLGSLDPKLEPICYEILWQTPLVASIEYGNRDCPLCAWGISHRVWFVLGFWIPSDITSSWVS